MILHLSNLAFGCVDYLSNHKRMLLFFTRVKGDTVLMYGLDLSHVNFCGQFSFSHHLKLNSSHLLTEPYIYIYIIEGAVKNPQL